MPRWAEVQGLRQLNGCPGDAMDRAKDSTNRYNFKRMTQKKIYKKRMTAKPIDEELRFNYFIDKIADFYSDQICRLVGTTKKEMMSGSRMLHISTGRHALCYVLRTYHGNIVTLQSIANLLGRHHTSVIHSVQAVDPYLPNWRFINKIKRMTDDDLLAILQPENKTI